MNKFISWFLIPVLTLLVSGPKDWFTSNFSVVGSVFPQNVVLLIWAILIGGFYRTFVKRTIGQAARFLNAETELAMTDVSVCLLVTAVFLPYRPEIDPFISYLHLAMAFSATVLFFLAVTAVDLRLYVLSPELFSLPTGLLVLAIFTSFCLLILCNFLITSALELFLTLFSSAWLRLFDRRIRIFVRKKRMITKI